MIDTLDNLISFLYPRYKDYPAIQYTLARQDKTCLGWWPGVHVVPEKSVVDRLIGFTGRSYPSYTIPHTNQDFTLSWIAIDLDDCLLRKSGEIDYKVFDFIREACPPASIRSSRSGTGCHVIFCVNPILIRRNTRVSLLVKSNLQYYVNRLKEEEGLYKICKFDGQVFYLYGGKNAWVYRNEERISLKKGSQSQERHETVGAGEIFDEELNEIGLDFLTIIRKSIPDFRVFESQGIYVKEIYRALQGSKFEFETKSPMLSERWHNNGKLFIDGYCLCLYTSADGEVIKKWPFFVKGDIV